MRRVAEAEEQVRRVAEAEQAPSAFQPDPAWVAGDNSRATILDGLGEVDRVPVRVLDVRHALAPRHVVRRAEHAAA